ncbi:MAG: hypothetical protein ACR2Q4_09080 [Geminicoccaceae bacterium]
MRTIRSTICTIMLIFPTITNAQTEIENKLCNDNTHGTQECIRLYIEEINRLFTSTAAKVARYKGISRLESPTASITHYQCERGVKRKPGIIVIVDDSYVGEECLVSADLPYRRGTRWLYSETVRKVECVSKLREALELFDNLGYLCRNSSKI